MTVSEACASLVEALEARRTDIVKSLLDHLAGGRAEGLRLQDVLDNNCTVAGTLLHHAVQVQWAVVYNVQGAEVYGVQCAVQDGQRDAVRALLLAGASPGLSNLSGLTSLQLADSPEILQVSPVPSSSPPSPPPDFL